MKMAPSRGGLNEKSFLLCRDCQSNTKTIRVILRAGPFGNLVVKGKLSARNGSVALRQLNSIHK